MHHPLGKTSGWLVACWSLALAAGTGFTAYAASGSEVIVNADDYFPDTVGSRWRYRGEVVEGPLQKISTKQFMNVSTVKGTETIKGVTVKVFHDTNPGNHGPSDSYYRRDAAGIVYYGSDPGTALEDHLFDPVRLALEHTGRPRLQRRLFRPRAEALLDFRAHLAHVRLRVFPGLQRRAALWVAASQEAVAWLFGPRCTWCAR